MRFLLPLLLLTAITRLSAQINRLEYFVDQDPGRGNATSVSVTAGNLTQSNLLLPTGSLTPGFHTLYVRAADAQGRWSIPASHAFYNMPAPSGSITNAEYFIDVDPGPGSASAITINPGSAIEQTVQLPLGQLSTGFHSLYFRVKGASGQWSIPQQHVVYVNASADTTRIQSFDYFFTSGNFRSDTYTHVLSTPAVDASTDFNMQVSDLPGDQIYQVHIRAVASNGQKSPVYQKEIKVCSGSVAKANFGFTVSGRDASFIDSSRGATRYRWFFGDGTEDSVSNPIHRFPALGNYQVKMLAANFCNSDTITRTVAIKGLNQVLPARGGNSGRVTLLIKGAGFDAQTRISLRENQTILPDAVVALSNTELQATFDLTNKPAGLYDVVVNFGSTTATLPRQFEVIADTRGPVLSVDFQGRDAIRRGSNQVFELIVSNTGLVDAERVPVTLLIEGDSTMQVDLNADWVLPNIPGVDMNNFPRYLKPDSLYGKPFNGLVLEAIVPTVFAGTNVTYICTLNTAKERDLDISTWINRPISSQDISNDLTDCILNTMRTILGHLPDDGCFKSIYYGALENDNIFMSQDKTVPAKMMSSVANLFLSAYGCVPDINTPNRYLTLAKNMLKVYSAFDEYVETPIKDFTPCVKWFYNDIYPLVKKKIRNVTSFDPNEKEGPRRFTPENHLKGDAPFSYTIYFENLATATAPAQSVVILDTLDRSRFDLQSFSLQSYGVGDSSWYVPGSSRFEFSGVQRLRRNALPDLLLRTDAKLDTSTGVLMWRFLSIDPLTREFISDPFDGFLPPNQHPPAGEGHISFTVRPLSPLPDGTVISNRAAIYFDNNAPILTNLFKNTIDLTSPASRVSSLPATITDTGFQVSWQGQDAGAGVRTYDVYLSTNGGPFERWLYDVSYTTTRFVGQPDSSYQFFSIAKDYAGNLEAFKTSGEAGTRIKMATTDPEPDDQVFQLYPNPGTGNVQVKFQLSSGGERSFRILDLQGREIQRFAPQLYPAGLHQITLELNYLSDGIYLLEMNGGQRRRYIKMIRQ